MGQDAPNTPPPRSLKFIISVEDRGEFGGHVHRFHTMEELCDVAQSLDTLRGMRIKKFTIATDSEMLVTKDV